MKDNKSRDTAKMGPPRLTLVPKDEGADPRQNAPADDAHSPLMNYQAVHEADAAIEDGATMEIGATPDNEATADPVTMLAAQDRREKLRIIEAILFAAPEPMAEEQIAHSLLDGDDVAGLLIELQAAYATRGVNLIKVAGKWGFRTADDLSYLLQRYAREERRLSKAALETLAIIAYVLPVTRAESELIRGGSTSAGSIDFLLESGWIRPRGRRRAPGRPVTYGTTENFLVHFGLDTIKDLPGLSELKGAGLLDATLPPGFSVPEPRDVAALMPDELPLEDDEEDLQGALDLEEDREEADALSGDSAAAEAGDEIEGRGAKGDTEGDPGGDDVSSGETEPLTDDPSTGDPRSERAY